MWVAISTQISNKTNKPTFTDIYIYKKKPLAPPFPTFLLLDIKQDDLYTEFLLYCSLISDYLGKTSTIKQII